MQELLTAAQMRAAEQAAIAAGPVTGLELMERAGRGIVRALMDRRPDFETAPHRAAVLAGPGNNGGDGFVVARLLAERGWRVQVHLYGDPEKLPPDAGENFRRWCALGEVRPLEQDTFAVGAAPDLLVDALFGTGLTRPLPEALRAVLAAVNAGLPCWGGARPGFVLAVDCPSGLDLDSGRFLGAAEDERLRADLAVTFGWAKQGHYLDEGPDWCGALDLRPLGLPGETGGAAAPGQGARTLLMDGRSGEHVAGLLGKAGAAHKYGHGHALVVSGPARRTGAARLAARAALRVGAGLVTLAGAAAALDEHAAQVTAIMLREAADAEALGRLLDGDARLNALCLGPGLGVGAAARETVLAVLARKPATVLDADAVTSFADDPGALFGALHEGCVLTPHAGEFGRVFPELGERLRAPAEAGPAFGRVDAVRDAAALAGCTVLLKGPDTVIGDPAGAVTVHGAVYDRAAPWLATAGAGDVLAGMIAGLLARGVAPHRAAAAAAWLHVGAARAFGPGLTADDLPASLPAVYRDLRL